MSQGLGRGLGSLIPPKKNIFSIEQQVAASDPEIQQAASQQIIDIPLKQISPNPQQPRIHFDEGALKDLADSIEQHGLLEPVVVTPDTDGQYYLIAGERRFRAFTLLKKETIPAIVRTASQLERLELALIENIQREDLNPIERARSYAALIDEFGLTQVQAATKLGIPRSSLANALRFLDLPAVIQVGLAKKKITEGQAKVLLGLPTETAQLDLYQQILQKPQMTVREVTSQARKKTKQQSPRINHELQSIERTLQERFGTKVEVVQQGSGGVKIIIETYSPEELQRFLKMVE